MQKKNLTPPGLVRQYDSPNPYCSPSITIQGNFHLSKHPRERFDRFFRIKKRFLKRKGGMLILENIHHLVNYEYKKRILPLIYNHTVYCWNLFYTKPQMYHWKKERKFFIFQDFIYILNITTFYFLFELFKIVKQCTWDKHISYISYSFIDLPKTEKYKYIISGLVYSLQCTLYVLTMFRITSEYVHWSVQCTYKTLAELLSRLFFICFQTKTGKS